MIRALREGFGPSRIQAVDMADLAAGALVANAARSTVN